MPAEKTKVFLGWSGQISSAVADALHRWLPCMVQAVVPFKSSIDIEAGQPWQDEIRKQLGVSNFGVICLTPENVGSQWMHFEAGALSKIPEVARVCPFLFGLRPSDVSGPLTAMFQAVESNKQGLFALVESVNKVCGDMGVSSSTLETMFAKFWPDLEEELGRVRTQVPDASAVSSDTQGARGDRDILEEVLSTSRDLARRMMALENRFVQNPLAVWSLNDPTGGTSGPYQLPLLDQDRTPSPKVPALSATSDLMAKLQANEYARLHEGGASEEALIVKLKDVQRLLSPLEYRIFLHTAERLGHSPPIELRHRAAARASREEANPENNST